MTELEYAGQVVTPAVPVTSTKENIPSRRTVVYQTLLDPAVARISAEKNKHRLFKKFLFQLNNPDDIEFVSIEKYYEPYVMISGKYSIDYYRKSAYSLKVDREAKEVVLFNQTFVPQETSDSTMTDRRIRLEGEERIIRETTAFIILGRDGKDSGLKDFPSAPSEKNPEKLVKSLKMESIPPNLDLEVIRKRIAQRPNDVSRLLNEVLEIDERSLIYTPRFKVKYKCPKIGTEAYLEFDGVSSKLIWHDESLLLTAPSFMAEQTKKAFNTLINRIKPKDTPQP